MAVWLWVSVAFLSGSIPFALLVGRWVLGVDIRRYGDGNPGAFNVFRAGGRLSGLVAGLLDVAKGLLPVFWAERHLPPSAWPWVAWAAVAGHAFSPWLRFRGGKAIAVSLGVWLALLPHTPAFWALAAAFLFWLALVRSHPWVVALAFLSLGAWLYMQQGPVWLRFLWGGNAGIVLWKHRHALRDEPFNLRPWVRRRLLFWR